MVVELDRFGKVSFVAGSGRRGTCIGRKSAPNFSHSQPKHQTTFPGGLDGKWEGEDGQWLRVDLVRRISPDHVKNGQPSSWVFVHPLVQTEGMSLVDHDDLAGGDTSLDISSQKKTITIHSDSR